MLQGVTVHILFIGPDGSRQRASLLGTCCWFVGVMTGCWQSAFVAKNSAFISSNDGFFLRVSKAVVVASRSRYNYWLGDIIHYTDQLKSTSNKQSRKQNKNGQTKQFYTYIFRSSDAQHFQVIVSAKSLQRPCSELKAMSYASDLFTTMALYKSICLLTYLLTKVCMV